MIDYVFAIEIAGACDLTKECTWCPMNTSTRKRGFMTWETLKRAIHWLDKTDTKNKIDAVALHNFGEPLLHKDFIEMALALSNHAPITMSTNSTQMNEKMADKLAQVPWKWISLSPWKMDKVKEAYQLLTARGIETMFPPGPTHDWAGQANGPIQVGQHKCEFLRDNKVVIRWDGSVAPCCITDREEDSIGSVSQEPEEVSTKPIDLCKTCRFYV